MKMQTKMIFCKAHQVPSRDDLEELELDHTFDFLALQNFSRRGTYFQQKSGGWTCIQGVILSQTIQKITEYQHIFQKQKMSTLLLDKLVNNYQQIIKSNKPKMIINKEQSSNNERAMMLSNLEIVSRQ